VGDLRAGGSPSRRRTAGDRLAAGRPGGLVGFGGWCSSWKRKSDPHSRDAWAVLCCTRLARVRGDAGRHERHRAKRVHG
jgi:hypothetical protein